MEDHQQTSAEGLLTESQLSSVVPCCLHCSQHSANNSHHHHHSYSFSRVKYTVSDVYVRTISQTSKDKEERKTSNKDVDACNDCNCAIRVEDAELDEGEERGSEITSTDDKPSSCDTKLSSIIVSSISSSVALMFVYGTLKRGFSNHHHLEAHGITYFQNVETVKPFGMYLDPNNRSRPCLVEPADIPINELIKYRTAGYATCEGGAAHDYADKVDTKDSQQVCPFCVLRDEKWGSPQRWKSNRWGSCISGELYKVKPELLEQIDRFERVPTQYIRRSITVRGLSDEQHYNAEVKNFICCEFFFTMLLSHFSYLKFVQAYFNRTSIQRWNQLIDGEYELLREYTLRHHQLYKPRETSKRLLSSPTG